MSTVTAIQGNMGVNGFLPSPTLPNLGTTFGITGSLDPGKRARSSVGPGLLLREAKRQRTGGGGFSTSGFLHKYGMPEAFPHPAQPMQYRSASRGGLLDNQYLNPSMTTPDFETNPSVPGNETIIKQKAGYEAPGTNDFIIMANADGRIPQSWKFNPILMRMIDSTPRDAFTLPGFNYFLALQQSLPQNYTELRESKFCSPEHVLHNYVLAGVPNSEQLANNEPMRRYAQGTDTSTDVRLNIIRQARVTSMYNMFAAMKLQPGTPLYFILKRVFRHGKPYVIDSRGTSQVELPDNEDHPLSRCPWQLVPYADRDRPIPEEQDLIGVDDFGNEVMGLALRIGFVHHTADPADDIFEPENLAFDLSLIRSQTFLDFFIN